jgi:hypothetical protein
MPATWSLAGGRADDAAINLMSSSAEYKQATQFTVNERESILIRGGIKTGMKLFQ